MGGVGGLDLRAKRKCVYCGTTAHRHLRNIGPVCAICKTLARTCSTTHRWTADNLTRIKEELRYEEQYLRAGSPDDEYHATPWTDHDFILEERVAHKAATGEQLTAEEKQHASRQDARTHGNAWRVRKGLIARIETDQFGTDRISEDPAFVRRMLLSKDEEE